MENKVKKLLKQGIIPTADNLAKVTTETNVEVLKEPSYEPHKITTKDFQESNRNKYSVMKNFLMNRSELQNAVSIARASQIDERTITIIAMVYEISKLPTGTLRLELEDPSGKITAIISKKNEEIFKKAQFICNDEVLGFIGVYSKNAFFVNNIIWPDIPQKQIPTTKDDVYISFLADTHIGSNMFLKKEFDKFLDWLSSDDKIAKKVKYVLFAGDIVDGVGVYPQQNKELDVLDIKEQHKLFASYIKRIPKDKQIVICPGTHEGVRIEEPKPRIPKHLAPDLYEIENVQLVTDPTLIRLHRVDEYPGITVLMYHGDSFDYYVNNVEALRLSGGYDKGAQVQKFLLQRRTLSPTYGGQEVLPMKEDPLIINQVPDVLQTAHIHKIDVGKYKGVILICSSCFQARTSYQEKLGHHPDPGKVILLNLKNLNIKILDFNK